MSVFDEEKSDVRELDSHIPDGKICKAAEAQNFAKNKMRGVKCNHNKGILELKKVEYELCLLFPITACRF